MLKFRLFLFLATALLITGCKRSSEITYTPPPIAEEWNIGMTQSGGIMGMQRSISVDSDGSYTVKDERAGSSVKGELTETQLADLQEMVTGMEFNAQKTTTFCADCFVYDLEIQSDGKKMILTADDVALPDSGIAPLVEFLRGVMDSALK